MCDTWPCVHWTDLKLSHPKVHSHVAHMCSHHAEWTLISISWHLELLLFSPSSWTANPSSCRMPKSQRIRWDLPCLVLTFSAGGWNESRSICTDGAQSGSSWLPALPYWFRTWQVWCFDPDWQHNTSALSELKRLDQTLECAARTFSWRTS